MRPLFLALLLGLLAGCATAPVATGLSPTMPPTLVARLAPPVAKPDIYLPPSLEAQRDQQHQTDSFRSILIGWGIVAGFLGLAGWGVWQQGNRKP